MESTLYLVLRENNPVVLQVRGRASFDNCVAARNFFLQRQTVGCKDFIVDLKDCRGADSTFLGVLAGLANNTATRGGKVVLTRPNEALLGVIHNLGLDRLLQLAPSLDADHIAGGGVALPKETLSELEQAKILLQAHENLIAANPGNSPLFMDVVEFLKTQIKNQCSESNQN